MHIRGFHFPFGIERIQYNTIQYSFIKTADKTQCEYGEVQTFITVNMTGSFLHNLLPFLEIIHLSLDYESPQNFLASPPEPKIPIVSRALSLTIRLHNCCFIIFIVFLSVFPTILFSLWLLLSISDIIVGNN